MNMSCKVELCIHWRNKRDICSREHPSAPVLNVSLQQRSRRVRGREMMHFETCMASSSWHGYYQPCFLEYHPGFPCLQRHCHVGLFMARWTTKELSSQPHSSQTALLINWHADFPLHPTKERSITQDWHTKASFLFVICSLDTKSTPNAASSISVIETKHCELKIGDRSSATRAAGGGGGGNPHLNQQHWWLLIVPRRTWRGTVSQENNDRAQRCSSWGRGAAHNLVNSLQALRFERRLCKDKLRVWSLPCYTLAFPRITPLGWADQIQSAFTWNHRLAMGFGSDH